MATLSIFCVHCSLRWPLCLSSSFLVVLTQFLSEFHHTLIFILLEALCVTQVLLVAYGGSRSAIISEIPLWFKENSVKVHYLPQQSAERAQRSFSRCDQEIDIAPLDNSHLYKMAVRSPGFGMRSFPSDIENCTGYLWTECGSFWNGNFIIWVYIRLPDRWLSTGKTLRNSTRILGPFARVTERVSQVFTYPTHHL